MNVPNRVHVIPLGYERDRVVEPPQSLNADLVALITHGNEHTTPPYHETVQAQLKDAGIEVIEKECDIFDLYASLGEIAESITDYEEDDVYVNLATGSKVTAIAGMIACMATGATPYYVRAERYGEGDNEPPTEPVSYGVSGIDELPAYPIDAPAPERIAILSYLADKERASKKELIEYSGDTDLPYIRESSDNIQSKYRLLDANILDPLLENEYVIVETVGRKKYVSLTEDGRNTLRAFEYLADKV